VIGQKCLCQPVFCQILLAQTNSDIGIEGLLELLKLYIGLLGGNLNVSHFFLMFLQYYYDRTFPSAFFTHFWVMYSIVDDVRGTSVNSEGNTVDRRCGFTIRLPARIAVSFVTSERKSAGKAGLYCHSETRSQSQLVPFRSGVT
jgi:hypothetical protein